MIVFFLRVKSNRLFLDMRRGSWKRRLTPALRGVSAGTVSWAGRQHTGSLSGGGKEIRAESKIIDKKMQMVYYNIKNIFIGKKCGFSENGGYYETD